MTYREATSEILTTTSKTALARDQSSRWLARAQQHHRPGRQEVGLHRGKKEHLTNQPFEGLFLSCAPPLRSLDRSSNNTGLKKHPPAGGCSNNVA